MMRATILCFAMLAVAGCSKRPAATAFRFDPKDFHLDKAKIAALPPDELRDEAFGVISKVFEAKGVKDWSAAAKSLPPAWRAVYSTLDMEGEVMNGGFHQYFFNSRCRLLRETLEDLQTLGANEHAEIYEKAISSIDVSYYTSPERDSDDLEKFAVKYSEHQWNGLEKRFYTLKTDVGEHVARYIKAHPDLYR